MILHRHRGAFSPRNNSFIEDVEQFFVASFYDRRPKHSIFCCCGVGVGVGAGCGP